MGCTGISIKDDYKKEYQIRSNYIKLKTNEINIKFTNTINNIKSIERIRNVLINNRNKIIYMTGNCCTKNNTLQGIIYSYLLMLSTKSNGDIERYQLYFNIALNPLFGLLNCDKEDRLISNEINEYIRFLLKLEETFIKEKEIYYNNYQDFTRNYSTYKSILIQSNEELNKYQENIKIFKYIGENRILEELYNIFKLDDEYLAILPCDLKDKDFIKSINEKGKNIKTKGYNTNYEISYYGVEQHDRFGLSPEDGKKFYEQEKLSNNYQDVL